MGRYFIARRHSMKTKGDGMKSIAMVIVLIFAGLTASGAQAEMYSWTDDNGVKHYSHTPPGDRSVPVKALDEIQPDPATEQKIEKINEENVDAIIEAIDKEEQTSPGQPAKSPNPPSRRERIQQEKKILEEKIAWLEQLPPQAYANMRSKQAIIGRYKYRMEQLLSDPDAYFKKYGN